MSGAALRWARSGLMALSGPSDAAPLVPRFDAMTGFAALGDDLVITSARFIDEVRVDPRLLTERAALLGLTRRGDVSCNGSCRLIEARDGWVAINLPRESDLELIPAFIGSDRLDDRWTAVMRGARHNSVDDLVASGRLLGLAVAAVPTTPSRSSAENTSSGNADAQGPLPRDVAAKTRIGRPAHAGRDWRRDPPLVIDLSALWAGPLCGRLLADAGARVVKVESTSRPDSIRAAAPRLFDRLNAGKESVALDFTTRTGRSRLAALIRRADVVIGSARPRAFEQLDLTPHDAIAANPGLTWVAITAHGWHGDAANAVGFGDDAAAAAGLVVHIGDGRPMFAGDALADPLTGIVAATAALRALASGGGVLLDVTLRDCAAFVARQQDASTPYTVMLRGGGWQVSDGQHRTQVRAPAAIPNARRAPPFGADTRRVLRQLAVH